MACPHRSADTPCDVERTNALLRRAAEHVIHDFSSLVSGLGLALETLDLAASDYLHEDDKQTLTVAERNVRLIGALIAEYVRFRRFLEHHPTVSMGDFDVHEMLTDAVRRTREAATVATRVEGVPARAHGDAMLTAESIAALLRGWHSGRGGAAIVFTVTPTEAGVEVTVGQDLEPGTAPKHGIEGSIAHRLLCNAIVAQGGTARFAATAASHELLSFTLPRAGSAG